MNEIIKYYVEAHELVLGFSSITPERIGEIRQDVAHSIAALQGLESRVAQQERDARAAAERGE